MGKLLKYLKPYWRMVLLAPLLMIVEVICDLLQPTLLAKILDNGVAQMDIPYIIRTGALMIGITLVGMGGGMGCVTTSSVASQSFGTDLRSDVFKKIQQFSFANLDQLKTSSLITRLTNDITQIQMLVLMSLRIMVRAPLLCIGGIIMAVSINARLSFILLFALPALVTAFLIVMKNSFPLFTSTQKKLDRVNTVIRENLSGVRVVKAFVRSDFENKRFQSASEELMSTTVKAFQLVFTIMPVMMLVMNLSIVAVIWFGGLQVHVGSMTVGEVMAFINYFMQILFSMIMISATFIFITRASASAVRIREVLDTKIDIANEPNSDVTPISPGAVSFDHVFFGYEGVGKESEPVLKDVTFSVNPGETIAILGVTGSGKSSLVHLIPRLYDTTKGRVLIDGRDVRTIDLSTLRSGIGVVLQDTILFSGTIKENLHWGNEDASEEDMMKATKIAQAHDFIMSFPDGYNTQISQRGVNLSGGQKQRLAIARALIKKPAILILDDSTSSVDLTTEQRIFQVFKDVFPGCTTFIIAQRISTVLNAHRILLLENGQIVALGTHSKLLEQCPEYQEIYRSQLGDEVIVNG
ncbi:MAG: ABC transporter ATP-binding protein [Atribacterota bacterium]